MTAAKTNRKQIDADWPASTAAKTKRLVGSGSHHQAASIIQCVLALMVCAAAPLSAGAQVAVTKAPPSLSTNKSVPKSLLANSKARLDPGDTSGFKAVESSRPAPDSTPDTGLSTQRKMKGFLDLWGADPVSFDRSRSALPSVHSWFGPAISPFLAAGSNPHGGIKSTVVPFAAIAATGNPSRYSTRMAGASVVVVDGVDMSPMIDRRQLSMERSIFPRYTYVENYVNGAYFSSDSNMTPGGMSQLIARPEGNQWHGDFNGFPFVDRLADFATGSSHALAYKMDRYGGSLGGPIHKPGTYLFTSFSDVRQFIGENLIGYVPTAAFAKSLSDTEPSLLPILESYPVGTAALSGSTTAMVYKSIGNQTFDDDAAILRLDHDFNKGPYGTSRDDVFLHGSLGVVRSESPFSGGYGNLADTQIRRSRPITAVVGWTHAFNTSLVDDLRVGYVRGTMGTQQTGLDATPYSIVVPGLSVMDGQQSTTGTSDSYSIQNSVAWIHSRNTVSAGGELRRIDLNLSSSDVGRVVYSSAAEFAKNAVSYATFRQGVPGNTLLDLEAFGWLQDSVKVRSNLVVGAGVRYEFYNRPHEARDKAIPFDFSTCGMQGFCPAGAEFNHLNPFNFDPRVSVAWAPANGPGWLHSNLVVRAGAGIYHASGLFSEQSQPIYNEVQNFTLSAYSQKNLGYPITPYLSGYTQGIGSARGMSRRRMDPEAEEWSVSIQTRLPQGWSMTGTYFGAEGVHLPSATYINLIDPETGVRPNKAFGQIHFLDNTGTSSLNALSISTSHNLIRGLQVSSGFTWSHELDDGAAGDIGADAPQNPACPRCERASGDGDVRDTESLSSVYQLPMGGEQHIHFQNQFLNQLTTSWDFLNSFSYRGAMPVNVTVDRLTTSVATGYTVSQRPDRVWGTSMSPAGGATVHEWINPAAFSAVAGLYGTTGRNAARGPEHWNLNTGLRRSVQLPRGFRLRLQGNLQNILNHAQYSQPLADWSTLQFGQIVMPANPARVGVEGGRVLTLGIDVNR